MASPLEQAPTKTPTPSPESTIVVEPSPTPSDATKTQLDLSIVTGNIQRPNGMFWHDGFLYTSCTGDWTLYRIDAETGATTAYIYGIRNAHTLYAEGSGQATNLWIPDFGSNSVVRISEGVVTVVTNSIKGPWGITPWTENLFAVTSLADNAVYLTGIEAETRVAIVGLRSPTGVTRDGDRLYVANSGSARRAVEWFSTDTLDASEPIDAADGTHTLVSGLQTVTNIALGPDNQLYIAYALGTRGVIGRVDPIQCIEQGGCQNSDVEIVLYTELAAPLAGLTISDEFQLFVHSIFSPDLYSVRLQ